MNNLGDTYLAVNDRAILLELSEELVIAHSCG